MTHFRIKLLQAGTEHYINGMLTHEEAEERLDLEENIHRASGWSVHDETPGQLVLRNKHGLERRIQIELAE